MDFDLIRSSRKTMAAEIKNGRLVIRAPRLASRDEITRFIMTNRRWIESYLEKSMAMEKEKESVRKLSPEELRALADRALETIPQRVAWYAAVIGVRYGRITIRAQKTRWGSCSAKGNLNFNCLLMLAPPEVLDGVVVHELCHLKVMNHSRAFYREVEKVLPDYRDRQKWLRDHGGKILALIGA